MQNAECRMQNAECKMQNAKCRMQNCFKTNFLLKCEPEKILMQIRRLESRSNRNLLREVTNGGYAQNSRGQKEEQTK